jgi:hypothetical protein
MGCFINVKIKQKGDVAQMVERSLSMREALGSTPSFSTTFLNLKNIYVIRSGVRHKNHFVLLS